MSERQKIQEWIEAHKEEFLEDLKAVLRVPSLKGEPEEGAPFGIMPEKARSLMETIARRDGFTVRNYDGYVLTVDLNDKEKALDILAHLDVVPVSDDWTVTTPFEPVVKDGLLYARGSADDKGPLMTAYYSLRLIRDLFPERKKNVRLIFGTDEESGSEDLVHYYALEKEAPMSFSPDADYPLINIEKGRIHGVFEGRADSEGRGLLALDAGSRANVVPERAEALLKGVTKEEAEEALHETMEATGVSGSVTEEDGAVRVRLSGKGAHAASPEVGNNGLTALLHLLQLLKLEGNCGDTIAAYHALFPHGVTDGEYCGLKSSDKESGATTASFNVLHLTEGKLVGELDSRAALCLTEETGKNALKKMVEEAGLKVVSIEQREGHHVSEDSDFVRTLLSCYEEVTGKEGYCLAIGGGTYVHELKNGVAFGCVMPGTDNHMHGADEFVILDDLYASMEIFALSMLRLTE